MYFLQVDHEFPVMPKALNPEKIVMPLKPEKHPNVLLVVSSALSVTLSGGPPAVNLINPGR